MIEIVQGNALNIPLPARSVQCVVTSPPYWGLRDYGSTGQLGLETTPEEYVANMVAVFRDVWRVLRDDGVLWLNLGDSYAHSGRGEGGNGIHSTKQTTNRGAYFDNHALDRRSVVNSGLKPKDLVGIPWRVAFALQADGWYLRSDIIWCLSGGTIVYAKTQKGEMPMMLKDLARLDPSTVQLWNGESWTQLRGMSRSARRGDELEIVLRSGERIACTPTHRFPTKRGLLPASEIRVGDVLLSVRLPQPSFVRDCAIDEDAAWLAGLYVAEGSRAGDTIQIAGHADETARWDKVQLIAAKYGGTATRTLDGNNMSIRLYGKVLNAIIDELVTGRSAKDKGFAPHVWQYSDAFIAAMVDGYLAGDGCQEGSRWRLGFCRNYNLERDLRTACARLGYRLTLNLSGAQYKGNTVPAFRGELRKAASGHHNEKDRCEVLMIRKARCRYVYDLGVADEPHLFALSSGVLTHNSKPNPMPESVQDRPTKSHEYLFLLSKSERYYYDNDAIKEPGIYSVDERKGRARDEHKSALSKERNGIRPQVDKQRGHQRRHDGFNEKWDAMSKEEQCSLMRNKRDVWTVATVPYPGSHFATFPVALVEPCILAGSRPGDLVMDPFSGTATVGEVCIEHQRSFIGIELKRDYIWLAHDRLHCTQIGMVF